MRARYWSWIGAALLLTVSFGGAMAQAPDGDPPSGGAVCDVLQGGTPSLYGLCLAFCEAFFCEPDFEAADPFAECKPASRKIVDKYRERMQPGDPDMPCIAEPCPCFSAEEVLAIPPTDGASTYASCTRQLEGDDLTSIVSRGPLYAAQVREAGDDSTCLYAAPDVFPPRSFQITGQEAVTCRTQIEAAQEDPAVPCPE